MSDVRMSPYELFGLPETYVLDETLLAERHLAAMQKVHPDRFADRSAAERRVAEQWSAVINEAFETLKSPVKRAVWLAKKRGAEVETEGQVRMPADFLTFSYTFVSDGRTVAELPFRLKRPLTGRTIPCAAPISPAAFSSSSSFCRMRAAHRLENIFCHGTFSNCGAR